MLLFSFHIPNFNSCGWRKTMQLSLEYSSLAGHFQCLDCDCILSLKHGLGFHYHRMRSSISLTHMLFLQVHPVHTYSLFRGCSLLTFFCILIVSWKVQHYVSFVTLLKLLSVTVHAVLAWYSIAIACTIPSWCNACAEQHNIAWVFTDTQIVYEVAQLRPCAIESSLFWQAIRSYHEYMLVQPCFLVNMRWALITFHLVAM